MNRLFNLALPLLACMSLAVCPALLPGQCLVTTQRGPVGPLLQGQSASDPYQWVTYPGNPGQAFLLKGLVTVGGWDHVEKHYKPFAAGQWGEARATAPIPPPLPPVALPQPKATPKLLAWQLDGVDASKIGQTESHQIDGHEVAANTAYAALGKWGDLMDDSGKLWIVALAKDPAKRKQFADDFLADPSLADLRGHAHLWAGPAADPDHVIMRDRAGKPLYEFGGDITISLLDASGGELWRQVGYGGPADLQALRKADPNYRPDLTPGPNKKKDPPFADGEDAGPILLFGAIAVIGFSLVGRKRNAA